MHEHDFSVQHDGQYDVEWGENGDVVAYIDCVEPIITASHVDPQRDEVYEESRACLSTLTRYWTVADVFTITPDGEERVTDSETIDAVLEQVDIDKSAMSFVEFGNLLEVGDDTYLVVEVDRDSGMGKSTEFEIRYELAEVTIND